MKTLKYAILAVLFLFISCKPPQEIDPGGRWREYMDRVASTQKTGASVLIDYECDSACLILLSSGPGLRISKDAKFGVHETRYVLPHSEYLDNTSKRSEVGTKLFKTLLPECAVKLFEAKHAFDFPHPTYFSGEEVLKACPQIKEYIAK